MEFFVILFIHISYWVEGHNDDATNICWTY